MVDSPQGSKRHKALKSQVVREIRQKRTTIEVKSWPHSDKLQKKKMKYLLTQISYAPFSIYIPKDSRPEKPSETNISYPRLA